jgi:hypothetical protein
MSTPTGRLRHLAHDAQPAGIGGVNMPQQLSVQLRAVRILKHGERAGAARVLTDACEDAEFVLDLLEVEIIWKTLFG